MKRKKRAVHIRLWPENVKAVKDYRQSFVGGASMSHAANMAIHGWFHGDEENHPIYPPTPKCT